MSVAAPKLKDLFGLQRAIAMSPSATGVVGNVHLDDLILGFLLDHTCFPDVASAVSYYFEDGRRSANLLASLLDELDIGRASPIALLEFASGYGCVTRHLREALPEARITACDIHEQAVAFVEQELGVMAILSHRDPAALRLPRRYEVIFALSFFSHMPRHTWSRWLRALTEALVDEGTLIFTTHGLNSLQYFGHPAMPEDGFWFMSASEQRDLPTSDYGQTVVTRAFVEDAVREALGGTIDLYREAHWWGHQDLYVVRREACRLP